MTNDIEGDKENQGVLEIVGTTKVFIIRMEVRVIFSQMVTPYL
jgi:hypothetical protein